MLLSSWGKKTLLFTSVTSLPSALVLNQEQLYLEVSFYRLLNA